MIPATIFLAAFLLFQVQPMLAKQLLPIYGGSATVWTVCLLFFQTALLAGYAWAHITRRSWHLALVASSIPVLLLTQVGVDPGAHPTWEILRALTLYIGLPFFTLAATSPLLQRWSGSEQPYRLYAVSNAACLLALLSYPVLIEPWLALSAQFRIWHGGYLLFAALSASCVLHAPPPAPSEPPSRFRWRWFALSAAPAALLMASTNQMCQEIASVPFLWIAPLAIYLVSFIVVFDRPHWYRFQGFAIAAGALAAAACVLAVVGLNVTLWMHLTVYPLALFACLMLCHGELSRSRPEAGSLTRFYLAIGAGGAFGGVLVGLVAPALFRSYAEFPLSLGACLALGAAVHRKELRPRQPAAIALAFGVLVALAAVAPNSHQNVLAAQRGFYGVLRVTETDDLRKLTHGAILHGSQFLDPARRDVPTTYYSRSSAVGQVLSAISAPAKIGVIGLGTGTLAAYGKPGEQIEFYEINPEVIQFARRYFTFLADSKAATEVIDGDARLSLREQPPQNFDVLVVDAFSSDAIPMHLLTAECAAIYKRHLKPDAKLLFHISNHTLDLEPVVRAIARQYGWGARRISTPADAAQGISAATWMLLDPALPPQPGRIIPWTDQFAALWPVLK